MRPLAVVVPRVHGEQVPELAFAEDQHPVGEFGPGSQDEPLGVCVGPRTTWRDLQNVDSGVGRRGVEGDGKLTGPIPHQVPEADGTLTEVQQKVPCLLAGPRPIRVGGDLKGATGGSRL